MALFQDHFSEDSAGYAQFRPVYPQQLVNFLCDGLASCHFAWDAGCGSGQLSRLLATHFEQVFATDPSESQIAEADTSLINIKYSCELSDKSSLSDQSVDLATAAQAAHWFQLPSYYDEVRRVLKPQGRIALIGYNNISSAHTVGDVIDDIYYNMVHAYWPKERKYVENQYRDFDFPFQGLETPPLQIDAQLSKEAIVGYILSWSATKAYQKAHQNEARQLIASRIHEVWPEDQDTLDFTWPVFMRLGCL